MKLTELLSRWTRSGSNGGDSATGADKASRRAVEMCHELLSARGEISGTKLAAETLGAIQALSPGARSGFYDRLEAEFSADPEEVLWAADIYRVSSNAANLARLQQAVEAPRRELFRRLIPAPGGLRGLVDMRAELLNAGHPEWASIVADLTDLLTTWFNRAFLTLRRIDWRSSATVLEKLIEYEAVHQIAGWHDLRRRLEKDRRCYGYFHPGLPDEPLVFIEVALTRGISAKVQPLLEPDSPVLDPEQADHAMFYSITNTQPGLRGIPFGNFLIKHVVGDLAGDFPRIRRYATISPVPGFRKWLGNRKPETEQEASRLCAQYLLTAKKGPEPMDPVARFHLRNGARLERILWQADTSAAGLDRSAGMMVNYLYRLGDLEANHEMYTREARVVTTREIESLAKQAAEQDKVAGEGRPLPSNA